MHADKPVGRDAVASAKAGALDVAAKRDLAANGELRWAATLLNHVIFAGGDSSEAREELARVYTQLGYQAEAGSWPTETCVR